MSLRKKRLFTEEEIGYERVFEIRIRDLRERGGIKQRSFSLSVERETRDKEYESADDLKDFLLKSLRSKKYV